MSMSYETTGRVEQYGTLVEDRRQRIVVLVHDRGTTTVDELADEIVEWEENRGIDSDWADVHQHLWEVDLPALDDAGLVVFDADEGVVDPRHSVTGDWPPGDTRTTPSLPVRVVVAAVVAAVAVAVVAGLRPVVPVSVLWSVWAAGTVAVLAFTFVVEWY